MRIFLVGFMAAGKSKVGRLLARSLDWPFRDLDSDIAACEGQPAAEMILQHGEARFRDCETAALHRCAMLDPVVVATGGGAFTLKRNRRLIAGLGCAVWLDPPWDILCRRAEGSRRRRPLFESPEQARTLYETRLDSYRLADVRIRTKGVEPAKVVAATVAARLGLAPRELPVDLRGPSDPDSFES